MSEREISQSRLYEWLTGDEDSRMCKDIADEACNEQPRNFFLHLFAALGNKLADELSSARLVLPWLLGVIGAPLWMVGLLVPIREAGALLPQLFVAGFIRLKPQRKWAWVVGGCLQAVAALALALLALFGQGGLGGGLVLITLVALSLARGLSSIATKDVLGKTIAKQRRGNLLGWSGSVAGAVTLAAGGVLMLFDDRPGELALAALLGVAALGWTVNALCAARIAEVPGAVEGGENAWSSIKLGLRLLREDRNFLHFNLSRALLLASALALPYVALLGQQQSGAELGGLGLLIVVSGLAGMVASPVWGKRSDASSRSVLRDTGLGAAACCLLGAGIAWLPGEWTAQVWPYALVYALLVIVHAGVRLGRKTYLVDMAGQDKRALYVALSNTLTGVLMLVVGGMTGVLAQWLGTDWLLVVLAVMALGAAASAARLPDVE
ncbi:MFS transporter [Halomonas daqingensis]|uniref:MFS transporter n=1 Tax=Billgrantia desiderata TaxID=52021 RepID=A0ABS9B1P4_9GAMM|nr:MFS transporter [Halomonas desiderata]MCE8029269.1 MFS transporter [Halomonas desiderata]MCE8041455.1 MFS transporter [Halomonas desiderata]MCE8046030.1 MFS transporter [Halomonas desiderata]NIC35073.1 MFS transporter [Halomonas desiderata]OUE43511.1 MFS transporter [Halomonas desiderata SP1]